MDLDAYFERIGYSGPREPTREVLANLIAHQAASIPFEAIDVLLGRGIDIAPDAIFEKLVRRKRGGYCFEQNGLLRQALVALGFEVEPFIARILWMRPADAPPLAPTHMALRVRIHGRDYLADTGFGNGTPTAPLLFDTAGPQPTPLETFRLVPTGEGHVLQMQLGEEWAPVYQAFSRDVHDDEFQEANNFTSTHPESRFRHDLMLARATRDRRYLLLGNRMTVRPSGNEAKLSIYRTPAELRRAVEAVFLLPTEPDWQAVFERFTSPEMQTA
ncbi:MAG: arylamine N-acetyltransferase [Rhizobium sp.]|nr:arylamine N-acetyltransferase [Rhizobium sp.]